MKKNIIKLRLLTMAAAILLLAGCSNNNDFMENKPTAKGGNAHSSGWHRQASTARR